jgi:hypothetical protein
VNLRTSGTLALTAADDRRKTVSMGDKTKERHYWIAYAIGVTTFFGMSIMGHNDFAAAFGTAAGWTYAAFALQPTIKQAVAFSAGTIIWIFGTTYVLRVRHDAVGIVVMAVCAAMAYLIARPILREKRSVR